MLPPPRKELIVLYTDRQTGEENDGQKREIKEEEWKKGEKGQEKEERGVERREE